MKLSASGSLKCTDPHSSLLPDVENPHWFGCRLFLNEVLDPDMDQDPGFAVTIKYFFSFIIFPFSF